MQVDLTEQLLALDLVSMHDDAHYASLPDSSAPNLEDRPPSRLVEDHICVAVLCREVCTTYSFVPDPRG